MTDEERRKLLKQKNAQFFNQYRKKVTGAAVGEKEMELLLKSIPNNTVQKDLSTKGAFLKFVTEKTGAAVSEEELTLIKKMLNKK